jgi:protein-disulfide isomerase
MLGKFIKDNKIYIILAIIIVSALLYIQQRNRTELVAEVNEAPTKISASDNFVLNVNDDDFIYGEDEATITIIEYASLSCSHCGHFATEVFPEIQKNYIDTGKVKFIYRDFPLDEPALRASQLTKCVDDERYANFVKVLFKTQETWAYNKNFPEKLENIAKLGGMSGEEFHECMANKEIETQILESRIEAHEKLSITSTPTFFINGVKYSGSKDYKFFSKIIDNLLAGE